MANWDTACPLQLRQKCSYISHIAKHIAKRGQHLNGFKMVKLCIMSLRVVFTGLRETCIGPSLQMTNIHYINIYQGLFQFASVDSLSPF